MRQQDQGEPTRRRIVQLAAALPALWLAGCGGGSDGGGFALVPPPSGDAGNPAPRTIARLSSFYVQTRDGTRIAADLWLPDAARSAKIGTVVQLTRYVRSSPAGRPEDDDNHEEAMTWLDAGLAYLIVDARGTGASFGARGGEQTPAEIQDFGDLFDWIAAQPWSNGRCGTTGVSYPGGNAELAVRLKNPHLKAVAPMFSYYDVYEHLSMPGGLYSRGFMAIWRDYVAALDRIDGAICTLAAAQGAPDCASFEAAFPKVKPVDGAEGGALLAAAQREHQGNVSFPGTVDAKKLLFRDDALGGVAWRNMSTATWLDDTIASGVPYHVRASWLDGGSADGALARFVLQSNPQEVFIGATSHGGHHGSDPFAAADAPVDPPVAEQSRLLVDFLRRELASDAGAPAATKRLHYVTLGEGSWRSTEVWPPAGGTRRRLHLSGTDALSTEAPGSVTDTALVADAGANTGRSARWDTVGSGVQVRVDRSGTTKLTRFASAPYAADRRITGHLQVQLELSCGRSDGTLLAYLEDLAPDGRITYITEGGLRLIHRRLASAEANPRHRVLRVPRTFARADASPMTPGERFTLNFDLLPTSVRIRAGHRLALCLIDRDTTHFDDYAGDGAPTPVVRTGGSAGSYIDFLEY